MHFHKEYDFLSNFYPCIIETKNYTFPTVEHAYQAAKTLKREEKILISKTKTPGKAKALGKSLTLRKDWEIVKIPLMTKFLYLKFNDPILKDKLLNVSEEIIEHNYWHDNFWGKCICTKCVNKKSFNILGRILSMIKDTSK